MKVIGHLMLTNGQLGPIISVIIVEEWAILSEPVGSRQVHAQFVAVLLIGTEIAQSFLALVEECLPLPVSIVMAPTGPGSVLESRDRHVGVGGELR